MFSSKWVCLAAAAVLSASVLVVADDATTQPAEPRHGHVHGKLTKPWSEITDLTDDQKAKITAVHAKALEEMKAIRDKEKEDIDAVLTEDQKTELAKLESKESEGHRASRAAKNEAEAPTTEPAK